MPDELFEQPETTFFGMPVGCAQDSTSPLVMMGVPCDGLVTENPGAAAAPLSLRSCTQKVGAYSVSDARSTSRRDAGIDAGDVVINRFDGEGNFQTILACVRHVVQRGAVPLLVGGDHSLTYPAVTAVAGQHGKLRLVQIDAHHDATHPAEWGCRYNHGTFVRNLIEDQVLPGSRIHQVGVRDFQFSGSGAAFVSEHGVHVVPMNQFDREGPTGLIEALRSERSGQIYLTLDIDSVDPAYAPGTGENMVGGLTCRQILHLVKAIVTSGVPIAGADLVEVVPSRDPSGRTCALASHLLALIVDAIEAQQRD